MHNDYLLSLLLGIIEGVTEFLPVSSTAHLRIAEWMLDVHLDSSFWKMYTIVIQLGAILTLPLYFRARIMKFLATFPKGERGDRTVLTHPLSLVLIAFFATALPLIVLTKIVSKNLENLHVMGISLLVGGIIMWAVEAAYKNPKVLHVEEMTLPQAVWIGLCQIFSGLFPGTSRSMSTIAAGQVVGMSREAALEFSFFLSIPTMIAATGKTGWDLVKTAVLHHPTKTGEMVEPIVMTGQSWIVLAIGFVVSFIVALGVVAWFMNWVRKNGFVPFAIYRILAGAALLIVLHTHSHP